MIAAVVAIVVSLSGNESPSLIVSPELILKYLASDSVSVKYLPSRAPPVNSVSVKYLLSNVPVAISESVTALACICSAPIASSAIFVPSTMSAAKCSLSIEPST